MLTKDGSTAQELATRLKTYDRETWDAVIREHNAPLTRYLFTFCPNASEDAAQITWLRAYSGIQSYDPELGQFRSWLFGIGHYAGLDAIRKAGRARTVNLEPAEIDQFPHGCGAPVPGLQSALAGCISHLSEDERRIVGAELFGWAENKDLAAKLRITIGNLYTIRSRAIAKIAKCLTKKGYDHVIG